MKENEKGRTIGGLQKEIEDLKQHIAMMDTTYSGLCADLAHWKNVANGLKGRNKQLSERLQHYKALDLEGDGLYEKKIAECEEKDKVVAGLNSQVSKLGRSIDAKDSEIRALKEQFESLQNYKSLPWWKKIFG